MAATDQTYRRQRTLDIVFGVSCVLMLLSIFWMLVQDFNREFKVVQRGFREVETALTERTLLDKFHQQADQIPQITEAQSSLVDAHKKLQQKQDEMQSKIDKVLSKQNRDEAAYQNVKAQYDSKVSIYAIEVDNRDNAPTPKDREIFQKGVDELKKEMQSLKAQLDHLQQETDQDRFELNSFQNELKTEDKVLARALAPQLREKGFALPVEEEIQSLAQLEDSVKKTTKEMDRYAKTLAQKRWKVGDWLRSLPIVDGFASPYKIDQISLNDLTVEYGSFKDVPRYDRCTSCHLAIERAPYSKSALARLGEADEKMKTNLGKARDFYQARQGRDEALGFDPSDLPKDIRTLPLTSGQVTQYCAHPRLDLFVDSNSPHPMEKFGCTGCHAGQGSATDFVLAVHSPNDAVQKKAWQKEYQWESTHDWEFPMLPSRFVESSCVKCHHQMTDLIREGSREEAPKLLRGYNLVKENGCFGCHEIAGIKSGRSVGPDLRLEPLPPLEQLTPEERAKIMSDPANPPGTLRRVGPSLRRIQEKTNEQWVRKWLQSPRGFRPDTKMPHFYGAHLDSPDGLPDDQKAFPAAEIHSIAHYLFKESNDYLKGSDRFKLLSEARLQELLQKQKNNTISEKEGRELIEVTRRLELAGKPTSIKDRIIDGEGRTVSFSEAGDAKKRDEQIANGRRLFTERGCLACHSHAGTETAAGATPAVHGDAHFGPNLSRIAAKLGTTKTGDTESARRWLVQWILNPNVHHPRTRMPITHLNVEQASDVAEWLLSQQSPEVKEWLKESDVPSPRIEDLKELAHVYLVKGPGVTRKEAEEVLKAKGDKTLEGFSAERMRRMAVDADERILAAPVDETKLKYYIGKKSISRLGCFGCHDIPGFEGAKPVGTPLNDWGKKDAERLAFEDIGAYLKEHYNVVPKRDDDKDPSKPASDWHAKEDKQPYEQFFADSLLHQHREGFLHQKLVNPRSYDYHRDRTWDDRLRMPQFRFGHAKHIEGESPEEYEARDQKEEAEAREAVMTFILGLVAEPVHPKYLSQPTGDRAAEVKGRQVLDKFNCAGCHLVRSGVYDVKMDDRVRGLLSDSYRIASGGLAQDHVFPNHNAWVNPQSEVGDRLRVHGVAPRTMEVADPDDEEKKSQILAVRLTDAVRFTDKDNRVRDLPAASIARLGVAESLVSRADPHGGTFADLLVPYLNKRNNWDADKAHAVLPPPLIREGERVQPEWLFQFLRNPTVVRPTTWMLLRMPKFNMSDDEAKALVNYFAAVDRKDNQGIGLHYPYLAVPEREESYWHQRNRDYVAELVKENALESRAKAHLTDLEKQLEAGKKTVKAAPEGEMRQKAEKEQAALEEQKKGLESALEKKDSNAIGRQLEAGDVYWTDAYRLLATTGKSFCLECHRAGAVKAKEEQGPALELGSDRLRPDWTRRWLANPRRLFGYDPAMPQNFPRQDDPHAKPTLAELMNAPAMAQITALRDVLLNFPKVADLPANRHYRSVTGGK